MAINAVLEGGDALPGIELTITGVSGGTAQGGRFRAGDTITIAYTIHQSGGKDWDIQEFTHGRALVSGPTSDYQPVIYEQSDVISRSVQEADGSYR